MLQKVLKMLMILFYGQANVERGFSVIGKLLFRNVHMESIIAQSHIHDHMLSHDLQTHDLDITRELLDSVISARKLCFQSQKERPLAREKSSKDCQLAELSEEISKLNTEATLLQSTISDLQENSDKALLDARKKQTPAKMRNEVTKASALTRAVTKTQEELYKTLAKKKFFIEKKDSLEVIRYFFQLIYFCFWFPTLFELQKVLI